MHRHRGLFSAAIASVFLLVMPHAALAADLNFDPATGSFPQDKSFSVNVVVEPATGETVNASDGEITFDKSVLYVASVSKEGSGFSLWTSDPTFSNADGSIKYSGGSPTSFGSKKKVLTITFRPLKTGAAKVSFKSGSVLAADGKGTDVYKKGGEATYTVTEAKEAPKESAAEPVSSGGGATPLAPIITSSTHPKEEEFYGTSTAEFLWKLSSDITGVRTGISDQEDFLPATLQPGAPASLKILNVKDGDSYFFVQFRNENGWGETSKRKIRVDTAPPLEFEVTVNVPADGTAPKFAFETKDELSGMNKYEIFLGDTNIASLKAQDLSGGVYPIPPQDGGKQMVTVKAYDKAGNVREFKKELDVPAVTKPKPKGSEPEAAPVQSGWTIERILAILFAFAIGGLITWNRYANQQNQAEKSIILHHVLKMRDVNDRIFSAMREEFEVMVNDLDPKPQLTPTEREFLEDLKEVLEISEGLIDTSIEELKNVVRGK